jgi:hypothetical protein
MDNTFGEDSVANFTISWTKRYLGLHMFSKQVIKAFFHQIIGKANTYGSGRGYGLATETAKYGSTAKVLTTQVRAKNVS